jgi:hypothetical protein
MSTSRSWMAAGRTAPKSRLMFASIVSRDELGIRKGDSKSFFFITAARTILPCKTACRTRPTSSPEFSRCLTGRGRELTWPASRSALVIRARLLARLQRVGHRVFRGS